MMSILKQYIFLVFNACGCHRCYFLKMNTRILLKVISLSFICFEVFEVSVKYISIIVTSSYGTDWGFVILKFASLFLDTIVGGGLYMYVEKHA